MSLDPLSLERLDEIPDPLGQVAAAVPPAKVPSERAATRAERRIHAWVAVGFALAWLSAAALVFGLRADLTSPSVLVPIAAWLAGGAGILALLLRPRERGLPAGVRAVQHAVWVVPVAYAAGCALVAVPAEGPLTWASLRGCLAISTLTALGPLTAAALFLRGSFLSAPGWRGAAVGALAGLAGSIGAHAHCPVQTMGHLLAAHGAAIAVGAAAGAALGRAGGRP